MLQQGLGTFDNKIDRKASALKGNPQAMGQLQQQQKIQLGKGIAPDLLDALAAQKALADKATAKQQLALSQHKLRASWVNAIKKDNSKRLRQNLHNRKASAPLCLKVLLHKV